MTAAHHPSGPRRLRDVSYKQAVELVQANQDTSCAGLQETENNTEPSRVFVRVVDLADSPAHVLIEMVTFDALNDRRIGAISAPMPRDAAKAISRLYDNASNITPSFQRLETVLGKAGQAAWASATSSDSKAAEITALEVCAYIKCQAINLKAAPCALVVITMTSDCKFVAVIRTVLDTVGSELPPNAGIATAVVIDDTISAQVRVQLLATGL